MTAATRPALYELIKDAPLAADPEVAEKHFSALLEDAKTAALPAEFLSALDHPQSKKLLHGVLGTSTYLSGLITRDVARVSRVLSEFPEDRFAALCRELDIAVAASASIADAMKVLRIFKAEVALLTALTDLGGVWTIDEVTHNLSISAEAAVRAALRFLFADAARNGKWLGSESGDLQSNSGLIVLGMGKLGAYELNYSSDIDLIVFFEAGKARVQPGVEVQAFFVRMTRDLVRMMEERTADGYVFRTDLRLRPDAGATQLALSTDSALAYYESVGQNWERAAMIKARPIAGDIPAGEAFLQELSPYIWRKYLDFAAIADVHAMKRQIHVFRGFGEIAIEGHNIKLGRGGIREIEFFAQTQQLIAGGRQNDLRVRQTLSALDKLVERGWIKANVRDDLTRCYRLLRRLEHRIQMLADEQTHEIPHDRTGIERLAKFSGYEDPSEFSIATLDVLRTVQDHYAVLFEDVPDLTADGANMVFAGEEDDPVTVQALKGMGYSQPSQVLAIIRGWHHGRVRAVRSERARERLTEVQPLLVKTLSETADPDRAFASFDKFISDLPSGVQFFSLVRNNPGLLRLIADIMGTAPRLSRILARRSRLLEGVLDPGTLSVLPEAAELQARIESEIAATESTEEALDRARVTGSELSFLIGVRVLSGAINADQAGQAYAHLAEKIVTALLARVEDDMVEAHGRVPGGSCAVIAMGKLGGREMTASSDLDLMVLYDFAADANQSDGVRPLAPSQYYARLTQRLITALTSPTAEGLLYEVDMRLRPSGQKGPLATHIESFREYQQREAWTWEHMALTRARVIAGPKMLASRAVAAIESALVRPRDTAKILHDIRDMRQRILAEKRTDDIWELKQVRGGLVDLEFIAQYLQLIHASDHPHILNQSTITVFERVRDAGLVPVGDAERLIANARLVNGLTQILRLCLEGSRDMKSAPQGLKELLARAGEAPNFALLEDRLRNVLADNLLLYNKIIGDAAG